jgi:hypothetical protein
MVAQAMAVLRSVSRGIHVAVHSTNVALHGSFTTQGEVAARIASYVTTRPEGPPSFTPSGVSLPV